MNNETNIGDSVNLLSKFVDSEATLTDEESITLLRSALILAFNMMEENINLNNLSDSKLLTLSHIHQVFMRTSDEEEEEKPAPIVVTPDPITVSGAAPSLN